MSDFKKLTTAEVASKRFTPVRMREGYSTDEVDEFLENVEKTIDTYDQELENITRAYNELKAKPAPVPVQDTGALAQANKDLALLRQKLSEAEARANGLETMNTSLQSSIETMGNQLIEARQAAENAAAGAQQAAPFDPLELDMTGATGIIARMLETAAKNHDDLIAQGESEAMRLKEEAEYEVEELLKKTAQEAEKTLNDAEAAKNELFAGLEGRKRDLEDTVAALQEIETRVRSELTHHYSTALDEIKNMPAISDVDANSTSNAGRKFGNTPSFGG